MWRKIQDLGLAGIYKSNQKVRNFLKLPQVLAFVPPEDVVQFDVLKKELGEFAEDEYYPQLSDFYFYFEKYYVGQLPQPQLSATRGRKPKTPKVVVRSVPVFKIEYWSVYHRVLEELSRTNNYTEAWHNSFSTMLLKHTLFYSLIDSFRREQKLVEDNIVRLNIGIKHMRKTKYMLEDEKLIFVLKGYEKEKFCEFYQNINNVVSY